MRSTTPLREPPPLAKLERQLSEQNAAGALGDGANAEMADEAGEVYRSAAKADDSAGHGLSREEVKSLLAQRGFANFDQAYLDKAIMIFDEDNDGFIDNSEFQKLYSILLHTNVQQEQQPVLSPSVPPQRASRSGPASKIVRISILTVGCFCAVLLGINHWQSEDPMVAPPPPPPRAPAAAQGDMTLEGSATAQEIEAELEDHTGGEVTISSYSQEITADATLPMSIEDFDESAEEQFKEGTAASLSVQVGQITDVEAESVSATGRRLQAGTAIKVGYTVTGNEGQDLTSINERLNDPSFAAALVTEINNAGQAIDAAVGAVRRIPELMPAEVTVGAATISTAVDYTVARTVPADADPRTEQQQMEAQLRDDDDALREKLHARVRARGGEGITGMTSTVAAAPTYVSPPPAPPLQSHIQAGACTHEELADPTDVSMDCSRCMSEADAMLR